MSKVLLRRSSSRRGVMIFSIFFLDLRSDGEAIFDLIVVFL